MLAKELSWNSPYVSDFIENINLRDELLSDYITPSSIRAMLWSRVPESENLWVNVGVNSNLPNVLENNSLYMIYVEPYDFYKVVSNIKEHLAKTELVDYVFVEKVSAFFKKKFPIFCAVREDVKRSIVIVSSKENALVTVQAGIPAFLPWYFKDKPVTQDEKELLTSLFNNDEQNYIKAFETVYKKSGIGATKNRFMISRYFSQNIKHQLSDLRQTLSTCGARLKQLNDAYNDALEIRRNISQRIFALELAEDTCEDETDRLASFFATNKSIQIVDSGDLEQLYFRVYGCVENFDPEQARKVLENTRSYIHKYSQYVKDVFKAAFVDESVRIRVCGQFVLRSAGGASPVREYGNSYTEGYMVNPHIGEYLCLGSYGNNIQKFAEDNDIIGVISQCIAAAKSLSMTDTPVMNNFAQHLQDGIVCVEMPDGKVLSAEKAGEIIRGWN